MYLRTCLAKPRVAPLLRWLLVELDLSTPVAWRVGRPLCHPMREFSPLRFSQLQSAAAGIPPSLPACLAIVSFQIWRTGCWWRVNRQPQELLSSPSRGTCSVSWCSPELHFQTPKIISNKFFVMCNVCTSIMCNVLEYPSSINVQTTLTDKGVN